MVYCGEHIETEDFSEEKEIKIVHPVTGMNHKLMFYVKETEDIEMEVLM